MIIKRDAVPMQAFAGSAPRTQAGLSDAGGLTQFGAHLVTLQPGQHSSTRHWHASEDEFLYMLDGTGTVIEQSGKSVITPGDCCCWPAGVENAHHVVNRSALPLTYLMVGTRVAEDTVRYPDAGRTLFHRANGWQLVADDGTIIESGTP